MKSLQTLIKPLVRSRAVAYSSLPESRLFNYTLFIKTSSLFGIPLSDCFHRLLRAAALVKRELWCTMTEAGGGVPRRLLPALPMWGLSTFVPASSTHCIPTLGHGPVPCAASSICIEVAFVCHTKENALPELRQGVNGSQRRGITAGSPWLRCIRWHGAPSSGVPWESVCLWSCRCRRSCFRCAPRPFPSCG